MRADFEKLLDAVAGSIPQAVFSASNFGLEREALRVASDGGISHTNHPEVLGSALTNPYITTDYAEALIEFITPAMNGPESVLDFLRDAEKFAYDRIGGELLWAASMPCVVRGETDIPIAAYGRSNAGLMKHVYRRGLGHRYGRVMQVISGIHFNFSLSERFWAPYQELAGNNDSLQSFISDCYFAMIRNLLRVGWLIPYLFGASPAVCKSFLGGQETNLKEFNTNTYFEPFATSLRMGDIGYQNNIENTLGIKACYDSVQAYADSLLVATQTPYSGYRKIGVVVNGEWEQLNANMLQVENEYYSTVRPKPLLRGNERPAHALKERGVRYVELRSLDINPFDPLGITKDQMHFLEALFIFCLFLDSPLIEEQERAEIDENEINTAHQGRRDGLRLLRRGREIPLREWGLEVLTMMEGVCEMLDRGDPAGSYTKNILRHKELLRDAESTPSAQMLSEMRANGVGFFHYTKHLSENHRDYFKSLHPSAEKTVFFQEVAERSKREQMELERGDKVSFDEYLKAYFEQTD